MAVPALITTLPDRAVVQSAPGGLERVGPRRRRAADLAIGEGRHAGHRRDGGEAWRSNTTVTPHPAPRRSPRSRSPCQRSRRCPLASSTETTGEVVKSVASPTLPTGWVVKASWLAEPAVMVKALALTGGVRTGLEVAARV